MKALKITVSLFLLFLWSCTSSHITHSWKAENIVRSHLRSGLLYYRYFWESNLYDVSAKELLYSVQTESFDPASSETLAHEYGKLIVADMVKRQVLTKPQVVASSRQ